MKALPEKPSDEVKIAFAGPLVNVALATVLYGIAYVGFGSNPLQVTGFPNTGTSVGGIFSYLALINVILAGFNLIPAFPLDGGRVLRAALWRWKGDLRWATSIAARLGSGFGLALIGEEAVRTHLATGRLVRVLPNYETPPRPIHLLFHPDRRQTPKLKTFIEMVVDQLGRNGQDGRRRQQGE